MPELPEVETVKRGLAPHLDGAKLSQVVARRPDLRFPLPDRFVQRLAGARVGNLSRRGKYILAPLDRGETLIIHLGMTGRFVVESGTGNSAPGVFARAAPADPKHAHVVFETDTGARLTYFDPRRFGFMDIVQSAILNDHPRFSKMGPEPLSNVFDASHLARAFEGRQQGPKTLLLDQHVVAGLGNIYVCEALHRAGISPFKPASSISERRIDFLRTAIVEVLLAAIVSGGSTLRDYATVDGAMGYFQHAFRVYGREGQACETHGCDGKIARTVQAGRSTFHCPACQI